MPALELFRIPSMLYQTAALVRLYGGPFRLIRATLPCTLLRAMEALVHSKRQMQWPLLNLMHPICLSWVPGKSHHLNKSAMVILAVRQQFSPQLSEVPFID